MDLITRKSFKDILNYAREKGAKMNILKIDKRILVILTAVIVVGCSSFVAMGSTKFSDHVPINAPGGWSDSPYISSDGKRLYFMYTRYNFAPYLISGGKKMPSLTGANRAGLITTTNAWDSSDIYVATKLSDGTWSQALRLPFNGNYADSSGMEFDNGNGFIWLQGDGKRVRLMMVRKKADGSWGKPQDLGPDINDFSNNAMVDNPFISPDGKGLWFTSNRPGGLGGKDIWFSLNNGGQWSKPINTGVPISSTEDDDQFWMSFKTMDLYWNSPQSRIKHCVSNGTNCGDEPDIIKIPGCDFAAEVSITEDNKDMYFACGDTITGNIKIMYTTRQSNGHWSKAKTVD